MPKLTDQFFNGLMTVYFCVFAIGVLFSICLRSRLKRYHPEIWAEIGTTIFNNSIRRSWRWSKWVLQRRYLEVGDDKLSLYGAGARWGFFAVLFLLLTSFVLTIVAQFQNGIWNQKIVATYPKDGTGIAGLILVVGYLAIYSIFFRRLKIHHPAVWSELGEPSLFLNNTPSNNWKVMRFVWSGRFLKINDPWISLYAFAGIIIPIILLSVVVLFH